MLVNALIPGVDLLDLGKNLLRFLEFFILEKQTGLSLIHIFYKDSKDLRDEALNKGMLTISMGAIKNNTNIADAATILQSKIVTQLGELRNPFIKVVEIKGNRIPVASASISEVSSNKMLVAKASFNGTVVRYTTSEGKEKREEKRGYMKEEVVRKDKDTGEEKKEVKYHKIVYLVVSKENNAVSYTHLDVYKRQPVHRKPTGLSTIDIGYPQVFGIDKSNVIGTDGRLRQHTGIISVDTLKYAWNEYRCV